MAMKFDLGDALINVVIWHRHKFMHHNLDAPEKALKVVLSREALDAILNSAAFNVEKYGKVDMQSDQIATHLIGLPVEISDDVCIMDIKDVRGPR